MSVKNISNESSEGSKYQPKNEVLLIGRVSSTPQVRELPSGDEIVEFRIVVDRGENVRSSISSSKGRTSRREVDTLDLAAWSPRTRRAAAKLQVDDWVSVEGAVRRRFWQAPSGLASRWQVEVRGVHVLK